MNDTKALKVLPVPVPPIDHPPPPFPQLMKHEFTVSGWYGYESYSLVITEFK